MEPSFVGLVAYCDSGIFSRVQLAARSSAVRIVSVTRRDYPGSTPFSADELLVLNGNGTESDRDQFQASRGLELVSFIDKFVQKEGISLSPKGGIAICGWSLGNSVTGSAIANFKSAPPSTIARLSPYIRTLVIHGEYQLPYAKVCYSCRPNNNSEPSPNIIGLDNDPRNYSPLTAVDPTIPEDSELPMFTEFVAGYFQHGNLSTRDPDVLEFYDHSFNLPPPSVYNMTASGHGDILVFSEPAKRDVTLQLNFVPQLLASYKALYTKELYETLPNLKNFFFGAEHTAGYGPLATWLVEEDDEAHGGGFIKAKLVSGINHMVCFIPDHDRLLSHCILITNSVHGMLLKPHWRSTKAPSQGPFNVCADLNCLARNVVLLVDVCVPILLPIRISKSRPPDAS